MDAFTLLQILPIEILIYKEKFENNHIQFKQPGEWFFTDEIEKILKDNNLTWSFRQLTMRDFEI